MNEIIFSNKSDEWETPDDLFNELNDKYNFTLDPASTKDNSKCEKFFTVEENGLIQSWEGERVFCNPPYSQVKDWAEKASKEAEKGTLIVMLVPSRTDTIWFHKYVYDKAKIEFLKGRLKFKGGKWSAPFPSMLILWNTDE